MYSEYESNSEGDYRTAIAAAAFAVKSFENQTRNRDHRIHNQGPFDSFTTNRTQPRPRSGKFSDNVTKAILDEHDKIEQEKTYVLIPCPSLKKKLSFGETTIISEPEQTSSSSANQPIGMIPIPIPIPIPSIKKTTTLKREGLNRREETSMDTLPHKQLPPPSTANAASTKISENVVARDTDAADEWEMAEMSRVKEKYDRLNATFLDWESKKKSKAKCQLDKVQVEPGKRRAKAVQHYRNELESIQKIIEGARSQAISNQRNEESKIREKANKFRLSGQLPTTCLCC